MRSKIEAHEKEIEFVKSILPVTKLIIETASFDVHALKNPEVLRDKRLYQQGVNYGYANTKAYVLARDGYECRQCGGKRNDKRLEVHHIIYAGAGGSDDESNLLTLCKTCHDGVHAGAIRLSSSGKRRGQLSHATQMNSIRQQLLNELDCEETFGYITKEHRQLMGLPKRHCMDAAVVATQGNEAVFKVSHIIVKRCVADGDYRQTKGGRSEKRIPTGKIDGFRKYDKVRYADGEYFICGRMSSGYAILMDVHGAKAKLKPIPKLTKMQRISARKSWITHAEIIPNIV